MAPGEQIPETQFATLGGDRIAYQVFGTGPPDLLWMSQIGDCIDSRWEFPAFASFLRRLGSFSRVVMFDRRGTGASDPVPLEALPTWEEWADDALVVLDAVGSERAAVLGSSDGALVAGLFAATHPDRTAALVLADAFLPWVRVEGFPWGIDPPDLDKQADPYVALWGTEAWADMGITPDTAKDPEFRRWLAKSQRMSCRPREYTSYVKEILQFDGRDAFAAIRVPALILHRKDSRFLSDMSRDLAERIPQARCFPVSGADFTIYTEPNTETLDHIEAFLTGGAPSIDSDRALAAILFTDIVGSTEQASLLGDRRWRTVLDSHDAVSRTIVDRHRGRLVKLTGDGVLATFDGPGRAIRCAFALRDALDPLGITIRAGLHTGEIEVRGDDIGGVGVHVAARVLDHAAPGELLASLAVPLLVTGSGIEFEDRGEHELKGVPGSWKLFAVKS
jgi:class 3 adenylate cyclase/alpha-beta hydrolase superfamily lysophospholipase